MQSRETAMSVLWIRAFACALVLSASTSLPAMAQNGLVMQVQSQKGSMFPGEAIRIPGIPNAILPSAWSYLAEIPTDQGGQLIGTRRYAPISSRSRSTW